MQDFLNKYHKRNIMRNVYMVLFSLVLAFGINLFLIDQTDFGKGLKTSILDAGNIENRADLYLENIDGNIFLKNNKSLENLDGFSVNLAYNPEVINIKNIKSDYGEVIILGDKNDGIINVILNSNGKSAEKDSEILNLEIEKSKEESTQINLLNRSSTGILNEFTTSGLTF